MPRAKMPTVLFPAADCPKLFVVADVAPALLQLEYVNLLRVLVWAAHGVLLYPIEKIPIADVPAAAPHLPFLLAAAAEATTFPE